MHANHGLVRKLLIVVLLNCGVTFAEDLSVVHLTKRDVHVHDPSTIVKCGNEYWVFFTGEGLPSAHSKDLITWVAGPTLFTNLPEAVALAVPAHRGAEVWAPDVIQLGDQYLLYYSVSTWGKNTSAIALATNPTLNPKDPRYHWTDCGIVVQSSELNDFNTIDPAVTLDGGGGLWLAFGSYWSGIKLVRLDPGTGKRLPRDSAMYPLAHKGAIEASYLHHHGDFYYLFVDWDQCCRGTNSTYNIRIGRSKVITGPYLDKAGVDMLNGGGSLFLGTEGRFIGPGHAGIVTRGDTNWFSCHFYDGDHAGTPTLGLGKLQWGSDGWPFLAPVSSP